jgi:hypothetical protein
MLTKRKRRKIKTRQEEKNTPQKKKGKKKKIDPKQYSNLQCPKCKSSRKKNTHTHGH